MAKSVLEKAEDYLRDKLEDAWGDRPKKDAEGVKAVHRVLTQFEIRIMKYEDFEPLIEFHPIWNKRARS